MKMTRVLSLMAVTTTPALAAGDAPNPFFGTLYQAAAAAIVFLTLLWLLKAKAWGPILKGLQDRENKIKGDLEQAEQAMREATATLQQYRTQLAEAQAEAGKIIAQSRVDAERVAVGIREKSQQELEALKNRAAGEINAAKEQAINDLYGEAAMLATHVAGHILRREIRPEEQQRLIEDSLTQLRG